MERIIILWLQPTFKSILKKKNYDIKGKHIHLVLLITDNYSIKIPTGNVDIYNLENLQYILELPKDLAIAFTLAFVSTFNT